MNSMFKIGQVVEIYNHSEPQFNGFEGTVKQIDDVRNAKFYTVELDNGIMLTCTMDELIEG